MSSSCVRPRAARSLGQRFNSAVFATAASLTALLSGACDLDCFEMGCDREGLVVSATREDGYPLDKGEYEIEIDADGQSFRAVCMLDQIVAGECELSEAGEDDTGQVVQQATLTVAGDDAPRDLRIALRSTLLHTNSIDLTGPQTVGIAIALDGVTIASTQFSPRYEREEPNGPECGACEHSEQYVDLSPPAATD